MKRVLFIDDEIIYNLTIIEKLESEGWEVQTAQNAFEAIDKLENEDFNLIMLDIMMESIGLREKFGEEVFRKTKSGYNTGVIIIDFLQKILISKNSATPIAIVTARNDLDIMYLKSKKNIKEVFIKPYSIKKFLEFLNEQNL